MANGLSDLFQNKLFLQYLASAGGAISAGQPVGPALNQVTQQSITAQNFSKLLAKVLGEGGKATINKEKTKIDMPTSLLGSLSGGTAGMREAAAGQLTGIQSIEPVGGTRQPNPFQLAL